MLPDERPELEVLEPDLLSQLAAQRMLVRLPRLDPSAGAPRITGLAFRSPQTLRVRFG